MTKLKTLLISALALSALVITGCDNDKADAMLGFLPDWAYTVSGGEYTAVDAHGNSHTFNRTQTEYLANLPAANAAEYVQAKFKSEFPADYIDLTPASVDIVDEITTESVTTPSVQATTAVNVGSTMVPGFGPLISIVGNGLLGIGALFYRQRGKRSAKVAQAMVQGIDIFRDVLDQTPQGAKIDVALKGVLKDKQRELGVANEVVKLLGEYATPTKQPIALDEPTKPQLRKAE